MLGRQYRGNKTQKEPEIHQYTDKKQCSAIVKARTRMLPVKENFKGTYQDTSSRWCKNTAEPRGIIDECPNTRNFGNMKFEDIFGTTDTGEMKKK